MRQWRQKNSEVTRTKRNASCITVSDVCKTTYEEIKKDKKHRYVIFYIRDDKQIDVETAGDRNSEYDQFLAHIELCGARECRYGLFDFENMQQCQSTVLSSKKQKLFLMLWCPDTAEVKDNILYSSCFDALKMSLVGLQKYIGEPPITRGAIQRLRANHKLRTLSYDAPLTRHFLKKFVVMFSILC